MVASHLPVPFDPQGLVALIYLSFLKGWKLSRCVFVGDAGMVSQENLDRLSTSGGKYILCMPMRRGDEVTHDVLQRPGRFQQVADNLRVKEMVVGEGERRRRYAVCHNTQEETR